MFVLKESFSHLEVDFTGNSDINLLYLFIDGIDPMSDMSLNCYMPLARAFMWHEADTHTHARPDLQRIKRIT